MDQVKQYELIENSSKKYYNGSVWESSSSGKFIVIGKTNRTNGKGSLIYCLCKFEDGAVVEADFTNIKKGNVKSPNSPSVYGVGFMGQGKWVSKIDGKTTKEYSTWLHMMGRCYSKNIQEENPSYIGVEVCERWHCFQNFCEDILLLEGYSKWKNEKRYELDKDILCNEKNIHPKIYSPETCMFIKKSENLSESTTRRNLTGLIYIATSPSGDLYQFTNQKEFAMLHELNSGMINKCIQNKTKHHKGWTFKVKS